ncbi:MAG: hypothetical protein QOG49_1514 [Frankiaceae bacterium]|nr:hypothetical protein [Frankiaceae bacterium]
MTAGVDDAAALAEDEELVAADELGRPGGPADVGRLDVGAADVGTAGGGVAERTGGVGWAGFGRPPVEQPATRTRTRRTARPPDIIGWTTRRIASFVNTVRMPLTGEYEPSPSEWARDQVELYERTNGAEGAVMNGLPVIIVTSRGAKTGKLRKTPLMRVEHDGSYAAVASKGGAPTNPVWYYNLMAEAQVEVQDGPVRRDMRARLAAGDERRVWWDRAVAAFGNYAEYQEKTEREIPLFILEPTD